MLDENAQNQVLTRLARIEGQVKGIARMVRDGRYCIDTVNQICAAQAALNGVTDMILRRHLETCVTNAMSAGNETDRREKIEELMTLYGRARA